jgi:hypothetical protein
MISTIQAATRKMTTRMNLKKALLELYHLACILSTFRKLNILAYTKIVKKFVKYVRTNDQAYLMDILQQSSLYKNAPMVETLIKELDMLFQKHFPTDPTYHKLKIANKKTTESMEYSIAISSRTSWIFTTEGCGFIGGLLNGINLLSFIHLIEIWLETTQTHSPHSFYTTHANDIQILKCIYFAMGLPILLGNGVIANMYIWQHFKINYRLIFGCTHSMLPIHFTILISSYTLFFLQYINASLSGHIHTIPLRFQPLICLLVLIGLTIYPWDFFYMNSRYWWNKSLSRIFVTPYYSIQFRDFFIVDQWMSMSTFFMGLGWLFAYTISGEIEWNSTITVPKPTWYTVALAATPAYIRCIQCVRRYWQQSTHATGYLHLINLGKYTFSIATIVILAMSTFDPDTTLLWSVLGLIIRISASCYSLVWDIVMDFGFGQMRYLTWIGKKSMPKEKTKLKAVIEGNTPQMTPPQSAVTPRQTNTTNTAVDADGNTGIKQRHTTATSMISATKPHATIYPTISSKPELTQDNQNALREEIQANNQQVVANKATDSNSGTSATATTPQLMVYPLWSYYAIFIVDIVLRFLWIPLVYFISPGDTFYILSAVEVIRRVCWNLFRVEIEHVHNCIAKRVIDTVAEVVPSLIAQELYDLPTEEEEARKNNAEEEDDSIHSQVFPVLPTQADQLLEGDEDHESKDFQSEDPEAGITSDNEVLPFDHVTAYEYVPSTKSLFTPIKLSPMREFGIVSAIPISPNHNRRKVVAEHEEMRISYDKEL